MAFINIGNQNQPQSQNNSQGVGKTQASSIPQQNNNIPSNIQSGQNQTAMPQQVANTTSSNPVGNFTVSQNASNLSAGVSVNQYQGPPLSQLSNVQPGVVTLQSQYSPETTDIKTYLDITESKGASDLHFTVGYPPLLRIDGALQRLGADLLTAQSAERLFKSMIDEEDWKKYLTQRELDFSYQNKNGTRFRINCYFDKGNFAAALRLIPAKIRTVAELGLPPIISTFTTIPHGLVLVTGPTGSGKSSTLAAIIDDINHTYPKHIITIEDPIEYIYSPATALIDQREVGKDTLSWTNALKYVLRQDPDVVLVGEMRDLETIASTITVAETGHLVFATLHTNSAAQTVDRIIDVFPEHQQAQVRSQLAVVLQGIVAQRLVPLTNGGRKAAIEILLGNSAVRNTIREGKTYQIDNLIQTSADSGMVSLEKSLAEMIKKGEVSLETALEYTVKPNELRTLVGS
jgi:twitching motility protein PilT